MKHAIALCLFSSTLTLFASSALAAPRKKIKPPKAEHAKPAAALILAGPAKAEGSTPQPKTARNSYWLAADPHVPLALVEGRHIRSVGKRGKACGAANRWARPKSRWHAVDAWGRVTGTYEVKGAETFDVTSCKELALNGVTGRPGAGLLVSDDSAYKPKESVEYAPSAAEKKRFERFLNNVESAFVDHKPLGKYVPWGKRTMFFATKLPKDPSWDGRVDGAGKPVVRPKRWAVSGGAALTIAYLGQHGQWHAAVVKPPLGLADSYVPVAVFDMNRDGIPEIVYRTSDGPSFAEAVMSLDPHTMRWDDAAESPGGGAL